MVTSKDIIEINEENTDTMGLTVMSLIIMKNLGVTDLHHLLKQQQQVLHCNYFTEA